MNSIDCPPWWMGWLDSAIPHHSTTLTTSRKDGYRKKVFLVTKIDGRTKKAAAEQIDECLKRLQTDVIDLMQHHEVIRMEDPDRIFATGGAQEAVEAAKKAGKIRYVGFTGHKNSAVHLHAGSDEREWVQVRHGPDAAECPRRPLPELREERRAGAGEGGDRRTGYEVDGRRPRPQE